MYQGFYLNLARSEQRRTALAQHLAERGAAARYRWFEAVDGGAVAQQYTTQLDPGNLGLWLSHARLLEAERRTPVHLHVIEDDTILPLHAVERFDRLLKQVDKQLPDWDLLFTDVMVAAENVATFELLSGMIRNYEQTQNHSVVDLQPITFACTSSFFLNRRSIDKYAQLLGNQWAGNRPIDLFIRDMVQQGRLKAYLTVPFMTSISAESLQSDIRGGVGRTLAVASAYRRAFFQDADLQAIGAEIDELTKNAAPPSALMAIYLKTLQFRLSGLWEPF